MVHILSNHVVMAIFGQSCDLNILKIKSISSHLMIIFFGNLDANQNIKPKKMIHILNNHAVMTILLTIL